MELVTAAGTGRRTRVAAETLVELNDSLLAPLIGADDETSRDREIERLVTKTAQPLVARIISRYAGPAGALAQDDAEDLAAAVNLRLVRKLRGIAESAEEAVRQFHDYVATLAYNMVTDHLRRRHPEQTRLNDRLRYVLTHDRRLALWTVTAGRAAGRAAWKGSANVLAHSPVGRDGLTPAMLDRDRPAEALVEYFRAAGQPLLFDALVRWAAEVWQISDRPALALARADDRDLNTHVSLLEHRDDLRLLWREIQLLPAAQRKALLLNLRDSETVNVVSLFALTGTATFDEIAAAIEMTPDRLASIWNDLPLDDLTIAALLGVSRQQVINLRKSARQRLVRRIQRPAELRPASAGRRS